MAEDAKNEADVKSVAKKGRATKKTTKAVEALRDETFQESIREQIENCKNELQIALEQSIENKFAEVITKKLKQVNRRHRISVIADAVVIVLLLALVGYFGYCLCDAKYFDFMKSECERNDTCDVSDTNNIIIDEVVKDTRWYISNYGYLFEDLQTKLNADKVEAYYLYSGDYKVSDMKTPYLLSMAYNKVLPAVTPKPTITTITVADMKTAFEDTFGTLDYYARENFTHGCQEFVYAKESDSFVTENSDCVIDSNREIIEEISEMYEEGNVLYILTTATIYDNQEGSFYSFDNLFTPVVNNAKKSDLSKYSGILNRYQYQFKKVGEKYHFSGIVKLK